MLRDLVLAVGVCILLCVGAAEGRSRGNAGQQGQTAYDANQAALYQAYLVKIKSEGLNSEALKAEGQVSFTKILWYLKDPNTGEIVTNASVQVRAFESGQVNSSKTTYFKQFAGVSSHNGIEKANFNFTPYNSKTELQLTDRYKMVEVSFRYDGFESTDANNMPSSYTFSAKTIAKVEGERVVVVGSMQQGEWTYLLLMRKEVVEE